MLAGKNVVVGKCLFISVLRSNARRAERDVRFPARLSTRFLG
jgi:hypothetical protein